MAAFRGVVRGLFPYTVTVLLKTVTVQFVLEAIATSTSPSPSRSLTAMLERRLASDWETLEELLADADPAARGALAGATRYDFAWAMSVVWSRAFGLTLGARAYVVKLVPMLDLLNHAPPLADGDEHGGGDDDASSRLRGVRGLDGCLSHVDGADGERLLVVRAAHAAATGDELFDSYGRYGDAKLLYSYGFVCGDGAARSNPWRQLDLWVHVPPSDADAESKAAALAAAGVEHTYDFRGTLRARGGADNARARVGIAPALLASLRVIAARGADETSAAALARAAAPGAPPLSARNELAALGALAATLRARLARAAERADEAERGLAAGAGATSAAARASARRRAMALSVRVEEASLVRDAIPVIERAMALLRDDPAQYAPPYLE